MDWRVVTRWRILRWVLVIRLALAVMAVGGVGVNDEGPKLLERRTSKNGLEYDEDKIN